MSFKNSKSIRFMVTTALLAAVICVLAPWSIPIGPVPISLATFAVCFAACVADWRCGTLAAVLYVLIGTVGLPVFSGFAGGASRLLGPTGGYIFSYIPMAMLIGILVDRFGGRKWMYPVSMLAGTAVCYALGTTWFVWQTGGEWIAALAVCVLPFLPGDAVKIAAATLLAIPLRAHFCKARGRAARDTMNMDETDV